MNSFNTNYLQIGVKHNQDELRPVQHPKNIYDSHTEIVSYETRPKNLTPFYDIPDEAMMDGSALDF